MAEGNRYRLFGLCIASELALPELPAATEAGAADVTIRLGRAPTGVEAPGFTVHGDAALLTVAGIGRYWISSGREIVVEPDPGTSERNLRLYLLGSAFAAILHQRALLPLHANAVVIDGRSIGFMGHPGAGKSTLAAWFHDHGFEVLADDVCVVTDGEDGLPVAHPGIPRLRLRLDALEATGRQPGAYEPAFDDWDKFNVPTTGDRRREAVPIDHLYLLEKLAGKSRIERLRGAAAVEALVSNTYRGAYVPLMGKTAGHLRACANLAARVPVFSAGRQWGYEGFDSEARALAEHARALIAGRSGKP